MPFLRHRQSGAVTDLLNSDSVEYQSLKAMKFSSAVTAAAAPSGTTGLPQGSSPGQIQAGQPVWEEIAEEDAGFPDPAGGRVLAVALPGAATGATETVDVPRSQGGVAGTLTDVEYAPKSAIPGVATNNRVVSLVQAAVTGTASPARAVTTLASVTFDATHSNPGGNVPSPLTISQAAFSVGEPEALQVTSSINGTGAPDPGGVLYAVYTRA